MTIKLNAATGGGSVSLSAPNSTTSNLDVALTLPTSDGDANQFLKTDGTGTLSWAAASTDIISEGNTSAEVIDTGSDGRFVVTTEGTERARVDSSGRLLVGTSSARTNIAGATQGLLIEGTSSTNSQNRFTEHVYGSNDTAGPYLGLAKTRSTSIGGNTIVQSGDQLGGIYFHGVDGSDFKQGASIISYVDGTPGTNDMPGRIGLATTADGDFVPTERMRISQNGRTRVFSASGIDGFTSGTAQGAGTGVAVFLGMHSATSTTDGTTSFLVYSNGNVQNTNNSYAGISDIKLKENIVDASTQWDDIKAIQVRNYNFKEETGQQTHTQIGLIAQEVELVSPGLVSESPDRDEEGNDLGTTTKSVNYSVLYMKAVKALQEAMERIETLEASNADLAARLTALEGGAS